MNCYVLYCQIAKIEKICRTLNQNENIHAYIPRMEKYIGSKDIIIDDYILFPGYLFVETDFNQLSFNDLLMSLNERRDGIIKELKKPDVSALTDDEIHLLDQLLDEKKVLRMSKGYKQNGKTVITSGPLIHFQNQISKVNTKERCAVLNISFLDRPILACLLLRQDIEA
ncbi:transcription termination/antitermination NusG family protein [Candidatus Stoquefichus sp. SB1]|jgi:transcription antitermination factor NusG|uniref:transcription termination/antitermination NusG family protein n=1 Tax=Candidatus Stoquefichus sp. SB1 TaxID=1658109 RepID=UPI00067F0505|nr:transcription termination/antitermination NusG family protein [Candidatus Stoquefichus sp. SB1]